MNEEIRLSRLRISRRRALGLGGTIGLGGLLAACGAGGEDSAGSTPSATSSGTATPTPSATTPSATPSTSAAVGDDVVALLDEANTCTMALEETQGPYWFDVDSIRSDLREDRPGTRLDLAVRVHDVSQCSTGGDVVPVPNSVVEIWHCDAGGMYSGFESGSAGGPGRGGSGETSDGSYSEGDQEAQTTDDGTYLRGAQVADANGIVKFTTIYPGWYRGRTVHIHLKVHIDKATVLTTQLYMDEAVNDGVFATSPYDERTGRDTFNEDDNIFDESGIMTITQQAGGYLGVINLGIHAAGAPSVM
jgi:protocatechuate 3,4-dioxygenase beta subunit